MLGSIKFPAALTTTVCDSFTSPAKLSSVGLTAGHSVCVMESNCSLDVSSWIETARISVAPSLTDAWSQFLAISYSSTSISGYLILSWPSPCFMERTSGFMTQLLEKQKVEACCDAASFHFLTSPTYQ